MNSKLNIKTLLKILLVEDNPGDVLIFREHLRFSGIEFELVESASLKDAINKISQQNFDVILLDLGLPDSIGLETLKKLNLLSLKTPVIVMTGLEDEETAIESLKEGVQDYLFKNNINEQTIIHSIRYSIERKKIQELQKKNALQFSILASATTSINESEEVSSIFAICCAKIKRLLGEPHVFTIESQHQDPNTAFYDWLETGFIKSGILNTNERNNSILGIYEGLKKHTFQNSGGKLIKIKDGLGEFSVEDLSFVENFKQTLDISTIYVIDFSRNQKRYGGIVIFSKRLIEEDEINLLEILANQVSLSIHRRTMERDLFESEQKFRILNRDLEQRVAERTKDLAKTNRLLEEELDVRIKLEKELIHSKNELEIRVQERTAELAKSEERFHNMFYNHEAVMLLIHPESGAIIDANKSAKHFYGHRFNTEDSLSIYDLNALTMEEVNNNIKNAAIQKNNYFILPHKLASGEIRTVEVYTSPIEMSDEKLLFAIIHDITQRRQMEIALKESEALYKMVVNNSLNVILISVNKKIEFINDAASDFIGIAEEKIIGKSIDELFKSTDYEVEGNSLAAMIQESINNNHAVEAQLKDKNGDHSSYFLLRSNTIQYKGKEAVMSIFIDITENKNIETYVLQRVIETEENDRKQFAADLHDDLGPILSTIKLRLDLMESTNPISKELKENISISNELIGLVVEKIRTISHNITPHLIETLGLDAGVKDLCKRIKELNKIDIVYESNIESRRFAQPIELHFYRIISELINNSLKHSQGKLITLILSGKENKLELNYMDDGKGYNYPESLQRSGGIGLRNILNRVTLINGKISFQSQEGKTIVKIVKKIDSINVSINEPV